MLYWNGIQSTTSIVVCARSTADGECTLTAGGQSTTATAATATDDGVVRLELTGLQPDTSYSYTVTTPNDSATGEIRTFPSSGSVKVAVVACHEEFMFPVVSMLADEPLCVIHIGDETYLEPNAAYFGTKANAITQAGHYKFRRDCRSDSTQKQKVLHTIGFGKVNDDHDTFVNNFQDYLTTANNQTTNNFGWTFDDQAEFDTVKGYIGNSVYAYAKGNPITSSNDTDPFYFSFECGDLEVFVLSHIIYSRTTFRPRVGAPRELLQANQLDWLKAGLSASTKPFKLICAPKATRHATNVNADAWDAYADMDTVLQWVSDNITGVMWVCGDHHSPGLFATTSGVDGETYDHVNFIAAPCGKQTDIQDSGAYTPETKWTVGAAGAGDTTKYNNYALFETSDTAITGKLISVGGYQLVKGVVLAGENTLSYPDEPVSI